MNFHVMTLFPEMIEHAMNESITGRAVKAGYISVDAVNIRDFAITSITAWMIIPMAAEPEW